MLKKLTRGNQGTKAHLLSPSFWFAIHSSPSPFLPSGGWRLSHLKIYAPNPAPTCSDLSQLVFLQGWGGDGGGDRQGGWTLGEVPGSAFGSQADPLKAVGVGRAQGRL